MRRPRTIDLISASRFIVARRDARNLLANAMLNNSANQSLKDQKLLRRVFNRLRD